MYHTKQLKNWLKKPSKCEALIYCKSFVYCIILLIPTQSAFNCYNKTVQGTKAHGGVTSNFASVQFPQIKYLKLNPLKSTKLRKLQMHPSKVLSDLLPDIISSSLNFFDVWSF